MTELLARVASGAAVHAARHRGRIAGCCPGPVVEIPPSYRDPAVPPRVVAFDGTLTIATIGQTGADARTTEVIRAIGRSPLLRRRVRCRVVGSTTVDERAHLERMVRAYALERVSFIGRIDESALSKELADVDAICCLGPPILEGGPENVAMALLAGRPVLISDGGVHGELPDDVALKCRPGAEADDIARHLEAMLDEPQSILALGARGRAYAQAVHSPMRYASALLDLVNRATEASPWLRTAGQIGSVLANWGIGAGAPAAIAVGKILDDVQDRHVPAA
ncbi:MAG: glycosyltransferase [Acidisphaera sp.]|nr:glycosyltransferase [Acidisphaera sp.]